MALWFLLFFLFSIFFILVFSRETLIYNGRENIRHVSYYHDLKYHGYRNERKVVKR